MKYDHTSLTLWCIIKKSTDDFGNPMDAAEVEIDNLGKYAAQVNFLGIDLFTAAGKHVGTPNGSPYADDASLVTGGYPVVAPAGRVTSVGGLNTADGSAEVEPAVQSCRVVEIQGNSRLYLKR